MKQNEELSAIANSVAQQWAKIWLHDQRETLEEEVRSSINLHLNSAVVEIAAKKAIEIIAPRLDDLVEDQVKKWISSSEMSFVAKNTIVRKTIESALRGVPPDAFGAVANKILVSSYRMHAKGSSEASIAKKLGIGVQASRQIIKQGKARADKAKHEYELFFPSESTKRRRTKRA